MLLGMQRHTRVHSLAWPSIVCASRRGSTQVRPCAPDDMRAHLRPRARAALTLALNLSLTSGREHAHMRTRTHTHTHASTFARAHLLTCGPTAASAPALPHSRLQSLPREWKRTCTHAHTHKHTHASTFACAHLLTCGPTAASAPALLSLSPGSGLGDPGRAWTCAPPLWARSSARRVSHISVMCTPAGGGGTEEEQQLLDAR